MFVLKKTFEEMQLAWNNAKNKNEILEKKIDNLTSELNVTYDNLTNLEKELNSLKGYIAFLKMQHNIMTYDEFIKTQKSTQDNRIVPQKVKPSLTPASNVNKFTSNLHPGVPIREIDNSLLVSYDGDMNYNRTKFENLNNQLNEVSEHIRTKCSNSEVNSTSFYDDNRNKSSVESTSCYSSSDNSTSSCDSSSTSSCD